MRGDMSSLFLYSRRGMLILRAIFWGMFIFLDIKYIQNNGNIFKCDFCKVHPYQLIRKGPKFFSSPLGLRLRWRPKDFPHPRSATDYKVKEQSML